MDTDTRYRENVLTKVPVVILLAFICSALWGSAFSGVKIGYEKFGIDSADWSSQMIFAGVRFAIAGIMALVFGSVNADSVMILLYLALVSAAAYSLWSILLKYNTVSKVAVFDFMNPVCGVVISNIVLKESGSFGVQAFVALVFACVGIFAVNRENVGENIN